MLYVYCLLLKNDFTRMTFIALYMFLLWNDNFSIHAVSFAAALLQFAL
jgi:hypothetical protein